MVDSNVRARGGVNKNYVHGARTQRQTIIMQTLRIVKHYKGKYYQVLLESQHTESGERLVTYQQLYSTREHPAGYVWTRPKSMFYEVLYYRPQFYTGCHPSGDDAAGAMNPGAMKKVRRFEPVDSVSKKIQRVARRLRREMRKSVSE